jgi:hypothetical protein
MPAAVTPEVVSEVAVGKLEEGLGESKARRGAGRVQGQVLRCSRTRYRRYLRRRPGLRDRMFCKNLTELSK